MNQTQPSQSASLTLSLCSSSPGGDAPTAALQRPLQRRPDRLVLRLLAGWRCRSTSIRPRPSPASVLQYVHGAGGRRCQQDQYSGGGQQQGQRVSLPLSCEINLLRPPPPPLKVRAYAVSVLERDDDEVFCASSLQKDQTSLVWHTFL